MDDKIVKLGFPEIIRLRPGMYVSSIENPTIIFREVVDNSIDEAFSYDKTSKISIITKGPDYIVADNGRGFPITLSKEHNVTSVELAVANLHAGSKFRKEPGKISVGTNGVGVSCTNALSEIFVVMAKVNQSNYSNSISAVKDSWTNNPNDHGNLFYYIYFIRGIKTEEGCDTISNLAKKFNQPFDGQMSTIIYFRPDAKIFDDVTMGMPPLENLEYFGLILKEYYHRQIEINYNGTDIVKQFEEYKFKFSGTSEIFSDNSTYERVKSEMIKSDKAYNKNYWFYVTFEYDSNLGRGNNLAGSVNSLVVNRGVHLNAFEQALVSVLSKRYNLDNIPNLGKGLQAKVVMVVAEAIFNGQTKEALTYVPCTNTTEIAEKLESFIKPIVNKNRHYFQEHVDRVNKFNLNNQALSSMRYVKSAVKIARNPKDINSGSLPPALKDATSEDRDLCELFLAEGDSAGGNISKVRDSVYTAVLCLRGRPLNSVSLDLESVAKNEEMLAIINALGSGVDGFNNIKRLRYGKVIIAADADPDGGVITAAILGLFGAHMKYLIDSGKVYVVESPLFIQDGKYIYSFNQHELNKSKPFQRIKGLGELNQRDIYKICIDPNTRRLVQITPEGIEDALKFIDKRDASYRRQLMIDIGVLNRGIEWNISDIDSTDIYKDE